MYVCLCNGHRERDIVEIARTGVRCARRAYDILGGQPQCGQCLTFAQTLIDDFHGESSAGAASAHTPSAATA